MRPPCGRRSLDESDRLGDGGRILVRPSGTEPLVRVMVEAPTDGRVRRPSASAWPA